MISFRSRILALSLLFLACSPDQPATWGVGDIKALASPPSVDGVWPGLSVQGDRVVLSWQESDDSENWFVKTALLDASGWTDARTVARSSDDASFMVNWADFAAVWPSGDSDLIAHWLVRGPTGGYDYGIRVARSGDDGRTWTTPWKPHEDDTSAEHGFVSMFPQADGSVGMVWLDGRETAKRPENGEPRGAMTLRYRSLGPGGTPGPEVLVDDRVCDCCQTDAALTSAGPIVVYRNRTEGEIRDIYSTRLVEGRWTEGQPVNDDGWQIAGCPVNGPAVAARGQSVAVAWFTGADDDPTVRLSFSSDAGATFGSPLTIDDGNPLGRVGVVLLEGGSALVSWLERTPDAAEVRVRQVAPDGRAGPGTVVTKTSSGRDSGFPQMVQDAQGRIVFAWTETGESVDVRMARTTEALR